MADARSPDSGAADCPSVTAVGASGKALSSCGRSYRGVALVPRSGRWRTTFKHKSHRYCLGTFSTAEEAARVWDLAAIKSRAPDFTGLNFPRETYAMEMDLLDKHTLEATLHMLKVKLIDAKRSGRAVKRKLDSALAEERDGQTPQEAASSCHVLPGSPSRKGSLSSTAPLVRPDPGNPFSRPSIAVKRCPRSSVAVPIARRPSLPAIATEQRYGSAPSALAFLHDQPDHKAGHSFARSSASPHTATCPASPPNSAPIHLLGVGSQTSPRAFLAPPLHLPVPDSSGAQNHRLAPPASVRSMASPREPRTQAVDDSGTGRRSSAAPESPQQQCGRPGFCSTERSLKPTSSLLQPFHEFASPRSAPLPFLPALGLSAAAESGHLHSAGKLRADASHNRDAEPGFLQRSLSDRAARDVDAAVPNAFRQESAGMLQLALSDDEESDLLFGPALGPWDSWAQEALLQNSSEADVWQPNAPSRAPTGVNPSGCCSKSERSMSSMPPHACNDSTAPSEALASSGDVASPSKDQVPSALTRRADDAASPRLGPAAPLGVSRSALVATLPTIFERRATLTRTTSLEELRTRRETGTCARGASGPGAARDDLFADAHPSSVPASPNGAQALASPFSSLLAPPSLRQGDGADLRGSKSTCNAWQTEWDSQQEAVQHSGSGARALQPAFGGLDDGNAVTGQDRRLDEPHAPHSGLPGASGGADSAQQNDGLCLGPAATTGEAGAWGEFLLSPTREAATAPITPFGNMHDLVMDELLEAAMDAAPQQRARDDLDLLGHPRSVAGGGASMWRPASPSATVTESLGALDRCFGAADRSRSPPCVAGGVAMSDNGLLSPHMQSSEHAAALFGRTAHPLVARASLEQPRSWRHGEGDAESDVLCGSTHRHGPQTGLHALRQGPFCSGRSIAAEWLQVPAVPLLPGTQCHDDAMVPGATGWTRRGGSSVRRPTAGRSLSVASRNISRNSFMLNPDVPKLGVASSLASECSEWYTSQREGARSWAGGMGAVGVRGNGTSVAGYAGPEGGCHEHKHTASGRQSSRGNASLHAHE